MENCGRKIKVFSTHFLNKKMYFLEIFSSTIFVHQSVILLNNIYEKLISLIGKFSLENYLKAKSKYKILKVKVNFVKTISMFTLLIKPLFVSFNNNLSCWLESQIAPNKIKNLVLKIKS